MQVEREEKQLGAASSTLRLPTVDEFQFVRYRIDGEVARLTLDRPEHNLLNERMLNELTAGINKLGDLRQIKIVVVESASKSFCGGIESVSYTHLALAIEKNEMVRVLHEEHAFSDRFISYMLARNIRVEEDLVDQLFNSTEKRLARTLLLLARYGKQNHPDTLLPRISQEMLAEMIGTTRSRVNFFMTKFRKLGFIHYNGGLQVHNSLLSVVLHE